MTKFRTSDITNMHTNTDSDDNDKE